MFKWRSFSFWCVVLTVLAAGCQRAPSVPLEPVSAAPPTPPPRVERSDWKRRWWTEKTVRVLRGGAGLEAQENPKALLAIPRKELVERLIADPRFGDMALDFELAFLGFRTDSVRKEDGQFVNNIYSLPQAISSVRALVSGGDFFSALLEVKQPLYLGPLSPPVAPDASGRALSPGDLRQQNLQQIQSKLQQMLAAATASPPAPVAKLCADYTEHILHDFLPNKLGLPLEVWLGMMFIDRRWYGNLTCITPNPPISAFIDSIKSILEKNAKLGGVLGEMDSADYHPVDLASIRELDTAKIDAGFRHTQFGFLVSYALQNSSTNMNRRRGAYFLKRYFCDNLTPVNVELPALHAGGKHGSDSSCFSCHYKLDPMAGYFRNYGFFFNDFGSEKKITFDDGAVKPFSDYIANWKAPTSAPREWNVGYIRSVNNEKLNDYGESIEDLFALLRRAPEVKRCLVQRLFEYLTSETQAVDGDYLDFLAEEFSTNAKRNSTQAFKALVSRIVLSDSFSTPNPNPEHCYDYRPGHPPSADAAPCRIASILDRHCTSCHQSTTDAPFLDLKHYRRLTDGTLGFPHFDAHGKAIPTKLTFQQIAERIASSDSRKRMPYLSEMPSPERQALYGWASKEETR